MTARDGRASTSPHGRVLMLGSSRVVVKEDEGGWKWWRAVSEGESGSFCGAGASSQAHIVCVGVWGGGLCVPVCKCVSV